MTPRVLLLHWNEAEALERAERLRRAGFEPELLPDPRDGAGLQLIRANPPDAVVIDLARQPSHGLQSASFLRAQKATRQTALVFIKGDEEKTDQVRGLLPDAVFTTWGRVGAAVRRALKNRPEEPARPGIFAGYSGVPLPKKLRIGENSVVSLLNAPADFTAKLEPLPAGVKLQKKTEGAGVHLAFMRSVAMLGRELPELARAMAPGMTLWLIWPKKTSGMAGDLGEKQVREMGLATGLVDYKICAVDDTWSGLAFALRKAEK